MRLLYANHTLRVISAVNIDRGTAVCGNECVIPGFPLGDGKSSPQVEASACSQCACIL